MPTAAATLAATSVAMASVTRVSFIDKENSMNVILIQAVAHVLQAALQVSILLPLLLPLPRVKLPLLFPLINLLQVKGRVKGHWQVNWGLTLTVLLIPLPHHPPTLLPRALVTRTRVTCFTVKIITRVTRRNKETSWVLVINDHSLEKAVSFQLSDLFYSNALGILSLYSVYSLYFFCLTVSFTTFTHLSYFFYSLSLFSLSLFLLDLPCICNPKYIGNYVILALLFLFFILHSMFTSLITLIASASAAVVLVRRSSAS